MREYVKELMDNTARIAEAIRAINYGWMCSWTPKDVLSLWMAAGSVREGGTLLEVGAGFSTGIVAWSLPHTSCRLVSVDKSEEACAQAKESLESVGREAEVILQDVLHADWLPEEVDVLFIDGEHDRPFALWCIEHLWPRVRPEGQIVLHDMHDRPRSRGEFETVMGKVWELGWMHGRTAFSEENIGGWDKVRHAGEATANCVLVVHKP